MFLDKHMEYKHKIECYVLNTKDSLWYRFENGSFNCIERPPLPHGRWVGIGTRTINESIVSEVEKFG